MSRGNRDGTRNVGGRFYAEGHHVPPGYHPKTEHDNFSQIYLYPTPFEFEILVLTGDITKASVDAVTTGEGLVPDDISGVTECLLNELGHEFVTIRKTLFKGGKLIRGQAYVSKIPQLTGFVPNYKHIIHAVVPDPNDQDWFDYLKALFLNVCRLADKEKFKSIAIPLLGTGDGQAETFDAVSAAVKGLHLFGIERKNHHLKQVQIVTNEPTLSTIIYDIVNRQFSQDIPGKDDSTQSRNGSQIQVDSQRIQQHRWNRGFDPSDDALAYSKSCPNTTTKYGGSMKSKAPKTYLANRKAAETNLSQQTAVQEGASPFVRGKRSSNRNLSVDNEANTDGRSAGKWNQEKESHHICAICMDKIKDPKELTKCKHVFCRRCIEASFKKHKPVCPTCQTSYGKITGNMPDGTMTYDKRKYPSLEGFEGCGVITVHYNIPDGVQSSEHPNPGQRYRGTSREAYLPNNKEGQKVLELLRVAFDRRLTFTVGRSATTGRDNVVTWNDIHHKTSMTGGEANGEWRCILREPSFGYPDMTYLSRVTEELASKGVTEEDTSMWF